MSVERHAPVARQLYILLPVHNRREITLRFVAALAFQTWRDFRLILIDDGSTDGTATAVKALLPTAEVITGNGNWWWAGSLEQGCQYLRRNGVADDDILLLMNDDVAIGPDFLARAREELAGMTDTLMLARQIDADTGKEFDYGGGIKVDLKELRFAAAASPKEINCLPTRGLFLRWRDMVRAGGFRAHRLPHYLSDYEFTLRAGKKGLQLRVAQSVSLGVHTAQSGRSLSNLYHSSRVRRFGLIFSRRFKDNPLTWSIFAGLVASPSRKPYLWGKIWFHFLLTAARCLYLPVKRAEKH